MTVQTSVVCDNSTAANYVSWASAVSNALRTFGWTNSSDTGQLNGAGAGNWGSVTTVPGSGAFYYEIFQPGDGLQNFFLKLEYGNSTAGANAPTFRITISTNTNGSGTATGLLIGPYVVAPASAGPSSTTVYNCYFSGDAGRICVMMWQNGISGCQQLFAIQRSLNPDGTPISTYITVWFVGRDGGDLGAFGQGTLLFNVGPAPNLSCWCVLFAHGVPNAQASSNSGMFNGSMPFATPFPVIGKLDVPCTCAGVGCYADYQDGVSFTLNVNGNSHTYISGISGSFGYSPRGIGSGGGLQQASICMQYD